MSKTIIGLFDTAAEAEHVVRDLIDEGFAQSEISVLANNASGEYNGKRAVGETDAAADAAGTGALSGTVIGGLLGLIVGSGLLIIPGIGPVLAAGPLAAALGSTALGAGLGAAAGGLVGGLVGAGVPEAEANYYAEGVRRGGTLVALSANGTQADQAYRVMQRHGAIDITQRGATWREEGWTSFNPGGEPYDTSDVRDRSDFARGMRDKPNRGPGPDYARGQHDNE